MVDRSKYLGFWNNPIHVHLIFPLLSYCLWNNNSHEQFQYDQNTPNPQCPANTRIWYPHSCVVPGSREKCWSRINIATDKSMPKLWDFCWIWINLEWRWAEILWDWAKVTETGASSSGHKFSGAGILKIVLQRTDKKINWHKPLPLPASYVEIMCNLYYTETMV